MGAQKIKTRVVCVIGLLFYIGTLSAQATFGDKKGKSHVISLSAGIASPYKAISRWDERDKNSYPAAWEIQGKGLEYVAEWGYGILFSGYRYKDKYHVENVYEQNIHEDILLIYLAPQISYRQEETLFSGVNAHYEAGIGYTLSLIHI